ncbi:amidohydrolase family protein [Amycolatopsis sp. NPDC051371]|uniref:amidohydrolase family protein n=1 Tax=Amycolatopsis sp. NPDC051371 TaxID=3155800 RepID=UPI003419BC3C
MLDGDVRQPGEEGEPPRLQGRHSVIGPGTAERSDRGESMRQDMVVDCHVHVFDPARFPYAANTFYSPAGPELGTPERLTALLDAQGVANALLVGPNSGYGEDNRCLLDTLERGAGRYRGMAVVPIDTSRAELAELRTRGIAGITLNAALLGTDRYADAGRLLRDLAALDMIADVQVTENQLLELTPVLEPSGARILIDHCGRPDPAAGLDAPGFRELLRWGRTGRAFVKLSGLAKTSREPYPHDDLEPFLRALLEEFGPDHCVWGSDWPFLRAPERIDYAPLLDLLARHVIDGDDRQRILGTTPRRLLGF